MTKTERKYLTAILLGVMTIVGWNVFLIQRDERMYDAYYRSKAIDNLKYRPSSKIELTAKEKFCQQQAGWHPDCNLE